MSDSVRKATLIHCVDARHSRGKTLFEALREATGVDYWFYDPTWEGGAGLLTVLGNENDRASLVERIKLHIQEIGVEKVLLTVHGTSTEDAHGCKGYILGKFEAEYESPERSRTFSIDQLQKAATFLRKQGIMVPIEAYYVTFSAAGINMLERVPLEEGAISPLLVERESVLQN